MFVCDTFPKLITARSVVINSGQNLPMFMFHSGIKKRLPFLERVLNSRFQSRH
jgi:hypothetical protein